MGKRVDQALEKYESFGSSAQSTFTGSHKLLPVILLVQFQVDPLGWQGLTQGKGTNVSYP